MATASPHVMATFPGSPSHPDNTFIAVTPSAMSVSAAARPVRTCTTKFASTTRQSILINTCASPSLTAATFRPAARGHLSSQFSVLSSQFLALALFPSLGYVHGDEKRKLSVLSSATARWCRHLSSLTEN